MHEELFSEILSIPPLLDADTSVPVELLGFSIDGPAPLGSVHVRARRGLNVLYGVNGAGKSLLLESIQAAATGRVRDRGGRSMMHLRILDPHSQPKGPWSSLIARELGTELEDRLFHRFGSEDPRAIESTLGIDTTDIDWAHKRYRGFAASSTTTVCEKITALLRTCLPDFPNSLDTEWSAVVDQIASDAVFTFTAIGDTESKWKIDLSFLASPATDRLFEPHATAVRILREDVEAQLRGDYRELSWNHFASADSPDGVVDSLFPVGEEVSALWGGTELCSHFNGLPPWPFVSEDLFRDLAQRFPPRPAWCPYPMFAFPTQWRQQDLPYPSSLNVIAEPESDVAQQTIETLVFQPSTSRFRDPVGRRVRERRRIVEASAEDELVITAPVTNYLRQIVDEANRTFSMLLPHSPILDCSFVAVDRWLTEPGLSWNAIDQLTGDLFPIDRLSAAQQRWATFSICLALGRVDAPERDEDDDESDSFFADAEPWDADVAENDSSSVKDVILGFFDEPEQHLHPGAITAAAAGLERLAIEQSTCTFVASHAPAFLRPAEERHLVHVRRGLRGFTEAIPVTTADIVGTAPNLGLEQHDVLGLIPLFLFVEGEHDRVVFEELIGDELLSLGVHMLALNGARNASSPIESQILLDWTDAHIVIALDRITTKTCRTEWDRLRAPECTDSDRREAKRKLQRLRDEETATAEERILAEVLLLAEQAGVTSRLSFAGLRKPDIIEYLPAGQFIPDATWPDLTKLWKEVRKQRSVGFKEFLREEGAEVTIRTVRKAAQSLDSIPNDITNVAQLCESLIRKV